MKAGVLLFLFLAQLNAYWPARDGSLTRYAVVRVLLHWNPQTRMLSVLARYPTARVSNVRVKWLDGQAVKQGFNLEFDFTVPLNVPFALSETQFYVPERGQWMLGEVGRVNDGAVSVPPEPYLPANPQGWHDLQTMVGPLTMAYRGLDKGVLSEVYFTRFATIGNYADWGGFKDVWWTSLEEIKPDGRTTNAVYNYAFARGIGLVDLWYSNEMAFDANGMAWGWEYFAVN